MVMTTTTLAEDSLATEITCKVSPGNSDSQVPPSAPHAGTPTRYMLEGSCMEECVADEKSGCCGLKPWKSKRLSCITRRDQLRFMRGHHCLEE